MKHEHAHSSENSHPRGFNWVLIAFLVIAAFFLYTEHRAHLFGALPFLFLLACLLMHLFMHRRHSTHENTRENGK